MFKRNIVFSFLFIVSISSILFSGYYTNDGIVEHDQYGWIDQTTGTLLSDIYGTGTSQVYNFENGFTYSDNIKNVILGIFACIVVEIIIGTEIRGGLDISRKDNPLVDGIILLKMLGPFKYIHTILGVSLLGLVFYLRKIIYDNHYNSSEYMRYSVNFMLVLMGVQIFLGETLVFFDVKPLVQLFHMWFSSLLIGLSVAQYTLWKISIRE